MSDETDYTQVLTQIVDKMREINHLAIMLPLTMRVEVFESAKRHFYIGQCLTNKQIKKDKVKK